MSYSAVFINFKKVVFKNFYNGSSSADKCTMFSDRNLINRRNVKADVDGAVNPCRKFFELEVNARLMAATMEIIRMNLHLTVQIMPLFLQTLMDLNRMRKEPTLGKLLKLLWTSMF